MENVEKIKLVKSMITRAEKLLIELENIYKNDLNRKYISDEALNVTHEVIEKCSNILDIIMTLVFEQNIKPHLDQVPKKGGYFPIANDEHSYKSCLGKWNATNLDVISPETDRKLRSLQPFVHCKNKIFSRIRQLANKKHTGLVPQIRKEQSRVTVSQPSVGSVSWGPGVTFGNGVSVMGIPIDPRTQRPVHNIGAEVTVETWVSFHFSEGDEDALAFCKAAVVATSDAMNILLH